jgi:hypothetical protein
MNWKPTGRANELQKPEQPKKRQKRRNLGLKPTGKSKLPPKPEQSKKRQNSDTGGSDAKKAKIWGSMVSGRHAV